MTAVTVAVSLLALALVALAFALMIASCIDPARANRYLGAAGACVLLGVSVALGSEVVPGIA